MRYRFAETVFTVSLIGVLAIFFCFISVVKVGNLWVVTTAACTLGGVCTQYWMDNVLFSWLLLCLEMRRT